jgi:hypothetical protein
MIGEFLRVCFDKYRKSNELNFLSIKSIPITAQAQNLSD